MSLSSYCRNCGNTNPTIPEMQANHCDACEKAGLDAREAAQKENPKLSETDLLYVAREARLQRAHHPRQTFISPREFNRAEMERK